MSYQFDAEPRVVQSRTKYRPADLDARTGLPNLMQDSKQHFMTPAQQEEEYVRTEKERIKIENMHSQLMSFKQSKKKVSPFDIKPGASPKIPVNLNFFLTDSTNVKPEHKTIDAQTDDF
mmetsp:Transcript_24105/g.21170  ORF Transcript_24105/g.21170 Transcript_24105/m.21170 type:complete len:119 (-) Transcript_24105:2075-2431(-)